MKCPICQLQSIKQCKCKLNHQTCPEGHVWFTCKDCKKPVNLYQQYDHGSFEMTYCEDCLNKPLDVQVIK